MNKAELEVVSVLLGYRMGALRAAPGPYRDVKGGRHHKVALELEAAGIGRVVEVGAGAAFKFIPYAMQEGN